MLWLWLYCNNKLITPCSCSCKITPVFQLELQSSLGYWDGGHSSVEVDEQEAKNKSQKMTLFFYLRISTEIAKKEKLIIQYAWVSSLCGA